MFLPKSRVTAMSASLVLMLALVTALTSISARVGAQTPPTPAPAPAPADFLSFASDELLNPLGTQRQRDLYIMRVDGTDKKKLTSGFNVWFASWSPDGKRLAVTTEGAQLFTLNPDGSDLKQIAGGAYSPPFWSPDGHFIAYVGGEKFALPLAKGNLRIVPAAGGTPWPVPHGEDIPSLPPGAAAVAWSPDGTRIATGWPGRILHIAGGPDAPVGVEALKGAGAGKFVIAGGWSPDNKHLAVTDGKDYGILDMSTGEFVSVAKSFPQPALARAGVSWSAGIRKVAFSINSAASDGQRLFLADFDGRNPKLILSHPHKAFYNGDVSDYGPPFFSADSKTMLLRVSRTTSLRGELLFTHESWLVNTDGSGGKKLTDGFNANWQPKTRLRLPDAGFWFTWRLYDLPVANGQVTRPYLWGPTAIYSGTEMLATAEDTRSARPVQDPALLARQVVYFDKGRMEIHDPNPLQPTRYLVTPGALAKELVTGQIYNSLKDESRTPPDILVVGDNPNADAPTYATFNKLGAGTDASKAQDRTGQPIEATLARDGTVRADAELGALAKVGAFVPETGHNLPDAFLAYFKSQPWDWIYIAGYPISEPYWAHVEIAGQPANVLVQVFERRTVTYDPAAPAGFKVQFGNVGKQYYDWRYTK